MSISKIVSEGVDNVAPGYILGAAAGATALGALIAYLASKGGIDVRKESDKSGIRDRSGGKHVGKAVNLL